MNFENLNIKYLSFGSPLIDIIGDVSDEFIKENNIQLNSEEMMPLKEVNWFSKFLTNFDVTNVMGGCQFNAMRVFNWMLKEGRNNETAFLGSVGDDEYLSYIIQSLLMSENIVPLFERINDDITGICLVACNKKDRAHITDLGASAKISKEFIDRVWPLFKDVKLIYTELFIIKSQRNFVYKLAEFGSRDKTIYSFNLPSSFIINSFLDDIEKLIEYADVIFADKESSFSFYVSYYKKRNILVENNKKNVKTLATFLSGLPKINKNKKRVAVITDGPDPAFCSEFDFKIGKQTYLKSSPPFDVDNDKIVDTNGAGDSLAGGFLSQYIEGKSLDKCMRAGNWAASKIIVQRGCQFDINEMYQESD